MEVSNDMKELVDAYFDQIEVENVGYYMYAGTPPGEPDTAFLTLQIPTAMLRDFLRLKGQNGELPDGAEFWKETCLVSRLRNSEKYHGQGDEPLDDILDWLEGEVSAEYQRLVNTSERIRLYIREG